MSEHNYIFAKVIGEGSFSTVYLAKDVNSNKQYAIKVCEKAFIFREKKQEYIKREKTALLRLSNTTGIVKLVCTFQSSKYLFFVLSFAKNGEILHYIDLMNIDCSRFYAAELLKAIEGMHKKNIIHRDLKPQNLFLDSNMHLLIGDLGSSKILQDEDIHHNHLSHSINEDDDGQNNNPKEKRKERRESFVGTALYVSPEILKGKKSLFSTDLFSYACILYEFICKKPTFGSNGENEYMVFQKIQNMDYHFPDNMNHQAKDLIAKLLIVDPEKRLGATDGKDQLYKSIRNHEFFESIDFDNIFSQTSPLLLLSEIKKDNFHISDDIETGLGESQMNRILQLDLASNSSSNQDSLKKLLEDQKTNLHWSEFVEENEYIIKHGFINKRKGLFSRRRMLLLTSTPRLIYIDAHANVKKGEIPFDSSLTCERRNFKIFFVHTPNRIYYLEDPEGGALHWCDTIEEVRDKYFKLKE
ncbi:unnamed protein product [Chironomus riparius]|uniref:3-phosphoinositide-dependent protein kinase 1 n=1 Tax=Chironomus riparius TaxID=315576 RepID=A0A9N9WMN3_9DIPT|nr:unnamed protein product [Chironomus riparius]